MKQPPSESKVISRAISRREDASTEVKSRPDLYETYQREIGILREFLQQQSSSSTAATNGNNTTTTMSTEEIEKVVRTILEKESNNTSGDDLLKRKGPLIKAVRAEIQDRADGKSITQVVEQVLKQM